MGVVKWCFAILLCCAACGGAAIGKDTLRFKSEHLKENERPEPSFAPFQFSLENNGSYVLKQGQKTWLQSAPTFLQTDGQTFSTDDNTLKLTGTSRYSGIDKIGLWESVCLEYQAGSRQFHCCFKQWISPPLNAIVFQQKFVNGASGPGQSQDGVMSAFPAVQTPMQDEGLAYVAYQGSMFGGTDIRVSRWSAAALFLSGGITGGPVALFDQNGGVAIVAPFSEFMSASRSQDENSRVSWGVMGGVKDVPDNFLSQTILYYGYTGINKVFSQWGEMMRFYYDKDDIYRRSDLTLRFLGYWTDGGAYYYYNTEPYKNYEQTILDVKNYTDSANIPYRYVQYDSWFYRKGPHNGVLVWSPTREVAPDGFQYIYNQTKWPSGAHNRYWSSKTPYAKANGGPFDFIVETEKAIPQDPDFWLYLFKEARTWGLILYEQDWLDREFAGLNATLSTVDVARNWLLQMGEAARETGLTIQYCMSNPRHAMQSLEIPAVTQARVSGDYRAGSDQWQIGEVSIFADAMGIAPFKDTFWTTKVQPGNPYGSKCQETNAELQAMVATLSTGPVGPSDMIGHTNVSMLMQCCRADGLVLRPSKPATAIDKQFWQKAWGGTAGPDGQVWTTYSQIGDFWTFGIILAAAMNNSYNITPADAGFEFFNPTVAYTRSAYSVTPMVYDFSESQPIMLTNQCTRSSFCVYYTGPVFQIGNSNIVLYGEEYKFVPMSRDRFTNIEMLSDDIQLTMVGLPGEEPIISYFVQGDIVRTSCKISSSGKSVLGVLSKTCRPVG